TLNTDVKLPIYSLSKGCKIEFKLAENPVPGDDPYEIGIEHAYCKEKPGWYEGFKISEFEGGLPNRGFSNATLAEDGKYHGIVLPKGTVIFLEYRTRISGFLSSKEKPIRIGKKEFKGRFCLTEKYKLVKPTEIESEDPCWKQR